jgi:hypothetical protein
VHAIQTTENFRRNQVTFRAQLVHSTNSQNIAAQFRCYSFTNAIGWGRIRAIWSAAIWSAAIPGGTEADEQSIRASSASPTQPSGI